MNPGSLRAEQFNELHDLQPVLIAAAERLLKLCAQSLDARPATADFEAEFLQVCSKFAKRRPAVG